MKTLIVRNDQGLEFEYNCEEFDGYDVFCAARDNWGDHWHTYQVLHCDQIIEKVINSLDLDPESAQLLH